MIADWRKQWGEELPFFAVQLAPYRDQGSEKVNYAELLDWSTLVIDTRNATSGYCGKARVVKA